MHKQILHTLFLGTADRACEHILGIYDEKGSCVVDYLYFANIAGKQLFDHHHAAYPVEVFREALLADYKAMDIEGVYHAYQQALLGADVVLPDGIALQLYYFLATKKRLKNLNGTDFCPYFLSFIKDHHPDQGMNLILYGTYPHLLEKTQQLLISQGYNVVYAQDGYTHLDREKVDLALKGKDADINILLVARSTPLYPIQEIRTLANMQDIRKHGLIVFNQGGTFDFRVGEQKRAPKIVRTLRGERLRRLVSDPKRNFKKVMSTLSLFRYILSYLILKKG